ncbi:MAG: substrate-binding domain-containing protein [Hyphomicrobiales bacterium]|nr:substrate-binding domain-containing protein [Hyphomicrobiales bacterium]
MATPATGATTIRQPVREKGKAAAQFVLGRRPNQPPVHQVLPVELVPRASTGSPP